MAGGGAQPIVRSRPVSGRRTRRSRRASAGSGRWPAVRWQGGRMTVDGAGAAGGNGVARARVDPVGLGMTTPHGFASGDLTSPGRAASAGALVDTHAPPGRDGAAHSRGRWLQRADDARTPGVHPSGGRPDERVPPSLDARRSGLRERALAVGGLLVGWPDRVAAVVGVVDPARAVHALQRRALHAARARSRGETAQPRRRRPAPACPDRDPAAGRPPSSGCCSTPLRCRRVAATGCPACSRGRTARGRQRRCWSSCWPSPYSG